MPRPSRPRSPVRLADVAQRAGVSLATASRALAGRDGVREEVAERVRSVSRELGYVANPHARTLAGGATSTVGLIVHEIDDPYFSEIASGVIQAAGERGLIVQICTSAREPHSELRQVRHLIAQRVGIIIIAGSGYVDPSLEAAAKRELAAFQSAGGRLTVIGRHALSADAVRPANKEGGEAIAEHLVSLGHRRIAVAAGDAKLSTVVDRLAGVAVALERAGLPMSEVPVMHAEFTRDGGHDAAERILREHPDTTAIIALNDAMALGVLSALRTEGVAVPQRMSVVGFNDVSYAADLAPGLTTVRLPLARMGQEVLTLALRPPAGRPRRKPTSYELIVRASTAEPYA
ncbi:LacI family transcriptional regulator [Streptomyces sp. YC504]|uniref:LacI family transcriptional regulator n=1 Tax=Streptomyces mesophilus TaxID=1775132 RepID=A0A6G4XSE3_9ACTN|nr:LacI family transcriptional regulator [Streptomyces mesophilus]